MEQPPQTGNNTLAPLAQCEQDWELIQGTHRPQEYVGSEKLLLQIISWFAPTIP